MCIVGRREEFLAEVKAECLTLRDPNVNKADILSTSRFARDDLIIAVQADFAVPENILHVRDVLQAGT